MVTPNGMLILEAAGAVLLETVDDGDDTSGFELDPGDILV